MQLVIGNKNYSSWSMRPWVLMRQLGIPFSERRLRFDFSPDSDFYRALAPLTPVGKVPVLVMDDGTTVWDSLAIIEALHDHLPDAGVWPHAAQARALARSLAAEMHSGFMALRQRCPMNIEARLGEVGQRLWAEHTDLHKDVAAIERRWAMALERSGGPFLMGAFSAADAFFAPVVSRLRTYGLPVNVTTQAYMDRVWAAPGVAAWVAEALAEHDFLDFEEPYRRA